MERLIDSFFSQNLSEQYKCRILRHCVKTSGEERSKIVELFCRNFDALLLEDDRDNVDAQVDIAAGVLYTLASDADFGLRLLHQCSDVVLQLYARILSRFLTFSRHLREEALRFTISSLVKFDPTKTVKVAEVGKTVAYLVRRLMRLDLPTNVLLDCGVIVVQNDVSRRRLTSSLWLLKSCEDAQSVRSVASIALCYGAVTATSSLFFSKIVEDVSAIEPMISLRSIMDSSRRQNDRRYLLAVFKFFQVLTRKIRFDQLALESHFFECLINFLWRHCDHFVDVIRSVSRQCLSNVLSQSDERITAEIQKKLMETDSADETLCCLIVNNCSVITDDDRLSSHCFHLLARQLPLTREGVLLPRMTKAYVTLLMDAYRGEFDFWFKRWIRPVWEAPLEETCAFRRDVIIAAITVCQQSLQILIDEATEEELISILDCILSIEDEQVRSHRMNMVDLKIFAANASLNPLAVLTLILGQSGIKLCLESLRATVDAIYYSHHESQRRMFVEKFKNIAIDDDFAMWVQQRCLSNLFAGASFDRRNCALHLLKSLSRPLMNSNFDDLCTLFACLSDSYEENQRLAFHLLKPIATDLCTSTQLRSFYAFVFEALGEANVSEHDSCAFVCQLLCCSSRCDLDLLFEFARVFNLKLDLAAISEDGNPYYAHVKFLLEIVKTRQKGAAIKPLYGFLRVIRHLLEYTGTRISLYGTNLLSDLAEACIECNLQVLSVVSQSSPEGFLPLDEFIELGSTDESLVYAASQKALLRGWRTIKETCFLLKHLLCIGQFDESLLKFMGDHFKTLLLELRHKGAIEVAYVAASTFCCVCARSTNAYLRDVPRCWLLEIVDLITSGDEGPLCRWRRSAGIPFIVQAVLNVDSVESDVTYDQFAQQLLKIYENDIKEESKIHSANILRVLFRNRNLAQKAINHMEVTLKVAIDGVALPNWNIRNASWLLLGSVISRISDADINGFDAVTFFRKFPSLLDFFCSRLGGLDRRRVKHQWSTLAVLLLIASFQPLDRCDHGDGSDRTFLKSLLPLLFECGCSPIWKIRLAAARAIRTLITRELYVLFVSDICATTKLPLQENSLHGALLQLEILLRQNWMPPSDEKCYLGRIFVDLVGYTDSILKSSKNSPLVKRQIFTLHALIFKQLDEWNAANFEASECLAADAAQLSSPNAAALLFEDEIFVGRRLVHLVGRQLRVYATPDSQLDQLQGLVEHCLRGQPAVAVAVLETFLLPAARCSEQTDSIGGLRDQFGLLKTSDQSRVTRCIARSTSVSPLLNRFVRDGGAGGQKAFLFRAIRVLSRMASCESFESLTVDEIEYLCSFVGRDQNASFAIVEYLLQTLKYSLPTQGTRSRDDLLRLLRCVYSLDLTFAANECHEMRIAIYDQFSPLLVADDILTGTVGLLLDVWWHRLEYAIRQEEGSVDVLLHRFYHDSSSQCEPSVRAIAFLGWSLSDIGVILRRIELQVPNSAQGGQFAFDENLPACFENRILLSRICAKWLSQLLHSHTYLLDSTLNAQLYKWLRQRCQISPAADVVRLFDVFSFLAEIHANLTASLDQRLASYLRRGALFQRLAIDSIGLVIRAFGNAPRHPSDISTLGSGK